MKKNFNDYYKEFHQYSREWYGKLSPPEDGSIDIVTFGYYSEEVGTGGEMSMKWAMLDKGEVVVKLEVFDDSFAALAQFKSIIDELAELDGKTIQPDKFCELLLRHGFRDVTTPTRN